ncbi:MAG TPA: ABC transporter permease [Anaerolineae bacterium]|nr:ABC transporter permease [Anaerolineae bacterium]
MTGVWTIARLTFDGAARRRVLWALSLLGLAALGLYALGLATVRSGLDSGFGPDDPRILEAGQNFLMMAGLYAANFLIVMMTVLISLDTLAGEIHNETIQSLAVKPLRRVEIVLGKWLGFAGILGVYIALLDGGIMLLVAAILGYAAPKPLIGIGVMYLESVLLLSLTMLAGSRLSMLAGGAVVFGLHGVAFIGGWVGQFGSLLGSAGATNIGKVANLILPTEGLWRYAAAQMQSSLFGLARFASPFTVGGAPGAEIIVYAAAFSAAALLLAIWQFNRRDL